ncbi:MAG: glycosyltransferase family 2 protein, partial [Opitutaceae bacterium]|nr:glycosyltransferase family 2 protein [Cytophagales bacterium]
MSVDISILIVSYNSENYLKACIESILNSRTNYRFEIIVVDNHSSDKSVEILTSYEGQIILLVNNYNYGFARAMNQSVLKASGNYILTFNPDAELSMNAIENALNYFKANKDVALMAPVITSSNGSMHYPNYNLNTFEPSSTLRFFADKFSSVKVDDKPKEVNFVFGTGIILDRLLLNNGKLYPEDTFLFWEEYYLGKQAQKLKKTVVINPKFTISHHRSVSFKFNKEKMEWMQKLILPYGYFVRIDEHGKLLAT